MLGKLRWVETRTWLPPAFVLRTVPGLFQQFHLLPRATVLDNILLPAAYPAEWTKRRPEQRAKALVLAERFGLNPEPSK